MMVGIIWTMASPGCTPTLTPCLLGLTPPQCSAVGGDLNPI